MYEPTGDYTLRCPGCKKETWIQKLKRLQMEKENKLKNKKGAGGAPKKNG